MNPKMGKFRRKRLKSVNFSIISNNCWGGMVYQYFNLPYLSPTVGVYFFPEEYLKLANNPMYYLNPQADLRFIDYTESKYSSELLKRGQTHIPIGLLNNEVEIVFLHYSTIEEAKEKWARRVKRIDWDHVLYKFAQMNNCSSEHIKRFLALKHNHKICLVNDKKMSALNDCKYYHVYDSEGKQISNDTDFPFHGLNIYGVINALFTK